MAAMPAPRTAFLDLSALAPAKTRPALIDVDLARFTAIAEAIDAQLTTLTAQRRDALSDTARTGRAAADRDQEVRRINSRIRILRDVGPQICLGRMDRTGREPVYIGRIGLSDDADRRLLVDWRTPAARPFFAATVADPMGLAGRRRFRWRDGRVIDYWDEALIPDAGTDPATMDAESAFIASLAASRSPRMPDVLATIRADQDAAVRAEARRPLIVEGGPGTGKTVVALHRAAYLLHADPTLNNRGGGVLLIGPHPGYLAYTADVLPDLGEDGARTATVADLLPQGPDARPEPDTRVAALKLDARMAGAVEPAVALYEEPPTDTLTVDTPWGEVAVTAAAWTEAFSAAEPGSVHNEARDRIWHDLIDILVDHAQSLDAPEDRLRRALYGDEELREAFSRAWPILNPEELVADLWEVPAYLRRCAPWLTPDEAALLRRGPAHPWTTADLPLLDAATRRLGDRRAGAAARRRQAVLAEQRSYMDDVVTHILDADDDPDSSLAMLRGADLRQVLLDADALDDGTTDPLAGPFAHIIVDEAQELADAQWQMLIRRCPSLSFTIVGDRAQARDGFPESWEERLGRLGFHDMSRVSLSVNYRTPSEVMEAAEPVIHAALPDAAVPTSVRSSGLPVRHGRIGDLAPIVAEWLDENPEGIAAVIGAPGFDGGPRVRALSPADVKGLEFDLVVIVDPEHFGDGITGAVDRYVAMTRTTSQLVILR
ncbi:Putative superfamily I DNA and RNA helicase [Acidipropionibacterium acidipropionici ATCC 4875]|uniref:Superfamily I DNA and RNA helicase n=2 Tax=Acidipropionibacterium acidipropionici TaxID=1748 RepID=K7SJS3_ACIA4|nr:Putative superfamily I DNA and RNA helicase [Acidipropionibacterium acidipropionici ATCC 4875]